MTDNWTENSDKTTYKHKANRNVVVLIRRNPSGHPKYLIFHSHPAEGGKAIMQEPEGANTMESARKRAEKHMRHWERSSMWTMDKDFNKIGKRAT